jgi:hypothetical protein
MPQPGTDTAPWEYRPRPGMTRMRLSLRQRRRSARGRLGALAQDEKEASRRLSILLLRSRQAIAEAARQDAAKFSVRAKDRAPVVRCPRRLSVEICVSLVCWSPS